MKTLVAVLTIAFFSPVSSFDKEEQTNNLLKSQDLYACYWFPYCVDPEAYSPVLQPKESKTETKDQKAIKLA